MKPHAFRLTLLSLIVVLGAQGCASTPRTRTPPAPPAPPVVPLETKLKRLPEEQKFSVPVYLKKTNGAWTASATGDLTDPDTERVKFYPYADWATELSFESGMNIPVCYSWSSEARAGSTRAALQSFTPRMSEPP